MPTEQPSHPPLTLRHYHTCLLEEVRRQTDAVARIDEKIDGLRRHCLPAPCPVISLRADFWAAALGTTAGFLPVIAAFVLALLCHGVL